jgi:hypothetical protein
MAGYEQCGVFSFYFLIYVVYTYMRNECSGEKNYIEIMPDLYVYITYKILLIQQSGFWNGVCLHSICMYV